MKIEVIIYENMNKKILFKLIILLKFYMYYEFLRIHIVGCNFKIKTKLYLFIYL
jgi:hypothetical protein